MKSVQKLIGLTGGIGSGKSTVARIFVNLGIPVFDADFEAKQLYSQHALLREELVNRFGSDLFDGTQLNTALLASRIFGQAEALAHIGQMITPYLAHRFTEWQTQHEQEPILIKEAAILIESGAYKSCDQIIQVVAPVSLRIARVKKRSGLTDEQVALRISSQITDIERQIHCDYTIVNDDQSALLPQVEEILVKIKDESQPFFSQFPRQSFH